MTQSAEKLNEFYAVLNEELGTNRTRHPLFCKGFTELTEDDVVVGMHGYRVRTDNGIGLPPSTLAPPTQHVIMRPVTVVSMHRGPHGFVIDPNAIAKITVRDEETSEEILFARQDIEKPAFRGRPTPSDKWWRLKLGAYQDDRWTK